MGGPDEGSHPAEEQGAPTKPPVTAGSHRVTVLASRLAHHLRCLREDATDPELTSLEGSVNPRPCTTDELV